LRACEVVTPVATGEDGRWMAVALAEAEVAFQAGEVPVGAVVVRDGELLSRAHNLRQSRQDPTAHAELIALQRASQAAGSWRLTGATIYVTLEPCPMCAGGIVLARVARLVYGAADPKAGAVETLYNIVQDPRLNHQVEVVSGVYGDEAAQLLRRFFQIRRQ